MAGVEEWAQLGIEIKRTFKTQNLATVQALIATVGRVQAVANIGMPAGLKAVVDAITRIDSYTSADPSSAQFAAGAFEFLHRPIAVGYEIVNGVDSYDVTDTWWGLQQWSAVIYPGGGWDPQGATA